jgi:hypothetical protein
MCSQFLTYKDCFIVVSTEFEDTGFELEFKGYFADVELPSDSGLVMTNLFSTPQAALYEGIQLAEKFRLDIPVDNWTNQ